MTTLMVSVEVMRGTIPRKQETRSRKLMHLGVAFCILLLQQGLRANAEMVRVPATQPATTFTMASRLERRPHLPHREFLAQVQARPKDIDLQSDFAFYVLELGDEEEAIRLLVELVSEHPEHALSLARLAYMYSGSQTAYEVVAAWERAEAAGWHENYYLPHSKGRALVDLGRFEEAITLMEAALEKGPIHGSLFAGLAFAYEGLERWGDAWYYAQWAQATNYPDFFRTGRGRRIQKNQVRFGPQYAGEQALWKAARLAEREKWDAAVDHYEEALRQPFYRQELRVWVYKKLGAAYRQQGRDEEAASVFREALEQYGSNPATVDMLLKLAVTTGGYTALPRNLRIPRQPKTEQRPTADIPVPAD